MEKFITYKKRDVEQQLDYINSRLDQIDFWARLMLEQSRGERENISMSDAKNIKEMSDSIKDALKQFKP